MPNLVNKTSSELVLNSKHRNALVEVSGMMAQAQGAVPAWLLGNQGGCFAIAMQAVGWGMNPFVVAQKSFQIKGVIGYESQLINAVACASGAISGRFKMDFIGDWKSKVGAGLRVGAIITGENDITWGQVHYFADIAVKNSPLWKTNPQQQMSYLCVKNWVRMYTPDALLGVYSADELMGDDNEEAERVEVEVNPESQNVIAAKKAIYGCDTSEYFEKLKEWVAGFSEDDQEALAPYLAEKSKEYEEVVNDAVDF